MPIDPKIPALALEFKTYANELSKDQAIFELDDTWPCIGTLNFFCAPLKGKQELSEDEIAFVDAIAAYIAGVCYACWSHFEEKLDISISLGTDEEGPGITISAQDGRFLQPNEKVIINISRALKFILREPPNPFPLYYKFAKNILPDENLISLFAIGLFSGQSPFSKGPWKEIEPSRFAPYLKGCEEFLANSSAAYYKRVFENEELGQIKELYLHNLIFPSYEKVENFPAYNATLTLMQKLGQTEEKPKALKELAVNLAQSPCPFISAAGFATSVALLNERLAGVLLDVATRKRDYAHTLRPAVMLARSMRGKDADWLKLLDSGSLDKAQKLLEEDLSLYLSPLLKYNRVDESMQNSRELFLFASWSNIGACKQWLEEREEEGDAEGQEAEPLSFQALMLKAYLELCLDELEQCKQTLDRLEAIKAGAREVEREDLEKLKAEHESFAKTAYTTRKK